MRRYGQQPTRLLWPQDSLGKNPGVGCHFLLLCSLLLYVIFTFTYLFLAPFFES